MTCGWAPDGRHFITATTAPRLRVDNALYVYKYNGLLLHKQEFFVLLEATWVPAPAGELRLTELQCVVQSCILSSFNKGCWFRSRCR